MRKRLPDGLFYPAYFTGFGLLASLFLGYWIAHGDYKLALLLPISVGLAIAYGRALIIRLRGPTPEVRATRRR
jgi:hypothetical protein